MGVQLLAEIAAWPKLQAKIAANETSPPVPGADLRASKQTLRNS
jgi:hypothetical protein